MPRLDSDSNVISHWQYPVENFSTSALEFYAAVERALEPRQIPDLATSRVDWKEGGVLSAKRVYLRVQRGKLAFDVCAAPFGTGFFFSSWLTELPAKFGVLILLAILFAGFFCLIVSIQVFGFLSGLFLGVIGFPVLLFLLAAAVRWGNVGVAAEDAILATPILGWLYTRLFKPDTFYRMDTTMMFQSAVHAAVLEAVDSLFSAKGIRAMTELERKPIMKGL
jgi:hypothetical protein